jgi:AraC family transcriptional regulator
MAVSDADERIVHESPGLRLGVFRCGPADWRWREVNDVGDAAHVVFAQTTVVIHQEGGRRQLCTPNNLVVYSPGQRYRRHLHDPAGDLSVFLALGPSLADELGGLRPGVAPCDAASHAAVLLATRIAARGAADATLAVEETLAAVLDRARRSSGTHAMRGTATDRAHAELVEDTKRALCADLGSRVSLEQLGRRVGSSRFQLARIFRAHTGFSIAGYRDQLRLRRALRRLSDRDTGLTEIALELGYSSHSHFTARFRREFGLPPSALRDPEPAALKHLQTSLR